MKIIQFSDYQETNDLSVLDGARWLLIHHSQLDAAAAVLFHTELLDILLELIIEVLELLMAYGKEPFI